MTDLNHIRNFSIVAHIDHGKSTLADRLLEECNTVDKREMEDQILDSMELERERGITIKARAVKLTYHADDGETYTLNLIDTPGHVDFNYEVSRSLAACEGAVLVVDASQGIEAQTLANTYLAIDAGLEVIPVVNKIDLPSARPLEVKHEIEDVIGIPAMEAPEISAKNGINIHAVLEDVVRNIPAPQGDREAPVQALIFDSQYDSYRGVIVYLRVKNGVLRPGMDIRMMATGAEYKIVEVGYLHPNGMIPADALGAGEVGYLTASIKTVADTRVGDTVTGVEDPCSEPLPGYKAVQPMVYSGVYPADGSKYGDLRDALEKLKLNDASMSYTQENSIALGFGFRCGFLGLLHMEIIMERLEREYNLDLITTAPNVVYRITKTSGETIEVYTPLNYPDPAEIQECEEPFVRASILTPPEYVGNIMELCQQRRGEYRDMTYLDEAGESRNPIMGCYGIGVGRLAASVCEARHDDYGPIWPITIAPWQVQLCCVRADDADCKSFADGLYAAMQKDGIEVMYDDRDVRAGVMFSDADLLGTPVRVVVSPRNMKDGLVEISTRDKSVDIKVPKDEALDAVKKVVADLFAAIDAKVPESI